MRTLAVSLVMLSAIVVGWLCWPSSIVPSAPSEPSPVTTPANAPSAVDAATASAPSAPGDATAQRTEAPAPAPAPTPIARGPEFVLRGRCVDALGQPLAGVLADLDGWVANDERLAAWTKDHDEPPPRTDANVTTGDDGAFEFHFWPPPPFQFSLDLTKAGMATMTGRWSQLAPGGNKDLGDIAMVRGTLLRGRVVDADGVPVGKVEVHFDREERERGEITATTWDIGYVRRDDGAFTGRSPLRAGTYRVDVARRPVKTPKLIVLDGVAAEQFVEVVLDKVDDSKAICGVVVDDHGQPVRGASVDMMPGVSGRGWIVSTGADGSFRVNKPQQGAADEVQLRLLHDDYEQLVTQEKFTWGRSDLRLTMRKALGVEVAVVAAADRTPIEDYQLRVVPRGPWPSRGSSDSRVRGAGHHDGGRALVEGVRRGAHFVVVEPKNAALATCFAPIEVADGAAAQVTVALVANVQREVRVQHADGAPVAGARLQLADASIVDPQLVRTDGGPGVSPRLQVMSLEQWAWNTTVVALELHAATTDAAGKALLRGPGDRGLVLFLPGPQHVPTTVADVRLDVAAPLVVTVSDGARLEGTLHPPESLAELRRLGGLSPTGPVDDSDRSRLPTVQLSRGEGEQRDDFPLRGQPTRIADDGSFALAGVPPGTWNVQLCWTQAWEGGISVSDRQPVGVVTLQDGATAHFDIDASFLAPGDLDGTVLHNDAPLANAKVNVYVKYGKDPRGHDLVHGTPVTTDAEGRFHLRTRAGECRVRQQQQQGERWTALAAPESIFVAAGTTVAQTFHIRSGVARVRVVDAADHAVADVTVELRDAAGVARHSFPPTGADGWSSCEIEPEPFTAAVLPRRLQDPNAQAEVWRANAGNPDPFATVRIALGELHAVVGETKEFPLRLPAGW